MHMERLANENTRKYAHLFTHQYIFVKHGSAPFLHLLSQIDKQYHPDLLSIFNIDDKAGLYWNIQLIYRKSVAQKLLQERLQSVRSLHLHYCRALCFPGFLLAFFHLLQLCRQIYYFTMNYIRSSKYSFYESVALIYGYVFIFSLWNTLCTLQT